MTDQTAADSPEKTLALFNRFISRTMGLHFSNERLSDLRLKIVSACSEFGFEDPEACMLWLMSTPLSREHLEILATSLAIGETYFFRDPHSYRALEEHVLQTLVRNRRHDDKHLRIWSAGCSSGEEPYSIAILLSRILPDPESWNIMLLATDINPQAIEKARLGVYGHWSFRDAPSWLMEYFSKKKDGRFEIIPRIRKMVQFAYLNLAEDCYPSLFSNTNALDLIFCRNVMLYFQPEQIMKVTARFHQALRDGGWLFLGPTEAIQRPLKGFSRRKFTGALGYQKSPEAAENTTGGTGEAPWTVPDPVPVMPQPKHPAAAAQIPAIPGPRFELDALPKLTTAKTVSSVTLHEAAAPIHGFRDACLLYDDGKYEQAAIKAREILLRGEERVEIMQLLAKAYANLGKFSEAGEYCKKAIGADRLQASSYYLQAVIFQEEGRLEEAVTALNRALYLDHELVPAYFALGNLRLQTGKKREAQRNFANALRLLECRDPNDTIPEADGLTAGRLAEIIRTITQGRSAHE